MKEQHPKSRGAPAESSGIDKAWRRGTGKYGEKPLYLARTEIGIDDADEISAADAKAATPRAAQLALARWELHRLSVGIAKSKRSREHLVSDLVGRPDLKAVADFPRRVEVLL